MPATVIYRLLKIRDPRSPGVYWFEVECRDPVAGTTTTVAVCDTREEARELIAAMRAAVQN